MHVWALGLWCETPAASGPPGLHTTTRELQTCTFEAPALQHTTRIPREDPRETQKERNGGGKGKKKRENFGPPTPFGAPPLSGPHPFGALPLRGPTLLNPPRGRFGQSWPIKDGQSRIGQSRSQPKSHPTCMFSVRSSDGFCCAFVVSLNLVMAILIGCGQQACSACVLLRRSPREFSLPLFLVRLPWFVARVFFEMNRFIWNILGHSGFCSCPGQSCNAVFNASLRVNSESAAFHSKLMSVQMYCVFVIILTNSLEASPSCVPLGELLGH